MSEELWLIQSYLNSIATSCACELPALATSLSIRGLHAFRCRQLLRWDPSPFGWVPSEFLVFMCFLRVFCWGLLNQCGFSVIFLLEKTSGVLPIITWVFHTLSPPWNFRPEVVAAAEFHHRRPRGSTYQLASMAGAHFMDIFSWVMFGRWHARFKMGKKSVTTCRSQMQEFVSLPNHPPSRIVTYTYTNIYVMHSWVTFGYQNQAEVLWKKFGCQVATAGWGHCPWVG